MDFQQVFLITPGVFPRQKKVVAWGDIFREEERARHLIGPIPISPTNKTGRKCLRGRGIDYTLHAGKRDFWLREDEAQKEKRKHKPGAWKDREKAGWRGVA